MQVEVSGGKGAHETGSLGEAQLLACGEDTSTIGDGGQEDVLGVQSCTGNPERRTKRDSLCRSGEGEGVSGRQDCAWRGHGVLAPADVNACPSPREARVSQRF